MRNHLQNVSSLVVIVLLSAGLLLTGCRTTEPAPRPVGPVAAGSFVRTWRAEPPTGGVERFYESGDFLFVYGPENQIAGFDRAGSLKFRASVGRPVDRLFPPAMLGGKVVFPTSGKLFVYSETGQSLRAIPLEYPLQSPIVLTSENVFGGVSSDTGGRLAAIYLDREYDIFRWTAIGDPPQGGTFRAKPALFENVIYSASEEGDVYALTQDRIVLWPPTGETPRGIFHTDGKILGGPAVDETGVYVASTDTKMYCLQPTTGRIRWEYFAGEPLKSTPVLGSEHVYLLQSSVGIAAFDKAATAGRYRKPLWTNNNIRQLLNEDKENLYVLTKSGRVAALDKKTGLQKFQSDRDDFVRGITKLDLKDPLIYVVTKSGKILAIRPVTKAGLIGEQV